MEFQECLSCGKYKYIESDGKCPSCVDNWAVILFVPHISSGEVVREGLSKEKAREIADNDPHKKAVPEEHI